MKPTSLILSDVYETFMKQKNNSDKNSNMRKACFEKEYFSYKVINEEEKKDIATKKINFFIKLAKVDAQMIYYEE